MPLAFSAVGYNLLGWFPDQEIDNLAIDNFFRRPIRTGHDMGEGRDKDNDNFRFDNDLSQPQNSTAQYNDPSAGVDLQSVNGVTSVLYNSPCVSFTITGPSGFLYEKSEPLISGFVSVHAQ
jgi:hypothetical protein